MSAAKDCGRCRQRLPSSSFSYRNKARGTRQSYCKDCANAAWRDWYSKPHSKVRHLAVLQARRKGRIRRNKALVARLKSVPCADCGERFPIEAMDFDHLEDKEALISKMVYTVGTARLLKEVAKCEVVCSNCHRVRTAHRLLQRGQEAADG